MKKKFRDFESAREFARKLKLSSMRDYREFCKSGEKPGDIPTRVEEVYKKDWKGWYDFLGTKKKEFRDFEDTRKFVVEIGLKNRGEWERYCKSGNKPDDIPTAVDRTYKKDWKGWGDFLGTGTIANQDRKYLSYNDAKLIVHKLKIPSKNAFFKLGDKRPKNIPKDPPDSYKKKGEWVSWGDFLGTGTIATFNIEYRPFKEARKFVRALGITKHEEWQEYCKSGNKPDDIPANPWLVYKKWNIERRNKNEKTV